MPNFLKTGVANIAQRFGYTIIPMWQEDSFPIVRYMRRLFALLDIDLVLDVGANEGQYYEFLREQVGYRGQVVSFEPVPHLFAALHARAAGTPNWQVDRRALGQEAGTSGFNIMKNTQMSSFLTPDHSRTGPLLVDHNMVLEQVSVDVTTLDHILPELMARMGTRNLYLKMDTQGFDLEVIKGASATLSGIAALQSEASVVPVYADMPPFDEFIRALEGRGFALSGIYPNNFIFFPRMIEFDCYMINQTRMPPGPIPNRRR